MDGAAEIEVSTRGAFACGVGLALSVAAPPLLPGVIVMCIMILMFDL